MSIKNILVAVLSLLFFMIGLDKFLSFLEPPCSLMDKIPSVVWSALGVSQIAAAVLIWFSKYRKFITGFFSIFMLVFTLIHWIQNTSDFGGSLFMAFLLGLLYWNPTFIQSKFISSQK